jgi:predicted RNA-binding protein with EMAP domain
MGSNWLLTKQGLFVTKFVTPNNETLLHFKQLVQDTKTSSDTFSHLIKATREYLHRFQFLQRGLVGNDNVIDHPDIKTIKMKAEQLLKIIGGDINLTKTI